MMIGAKTKSLNFTVLFHEYDNEVECNCCKFVLRAMLCVHAIYVLITNVTNECSN